MKPAVILALLSAQLVLFANCSPRILSQGVPIQGTSDKVIVRGQYSSVELDRVDRFLLENGKIVLQGSSTTASVDVPAGAEKPKPGQQWALVTEGEENGKRTLTFTHEQSLEDFTIAVPPGDDGQVHYVTMAGKNDEDVVVFAWGANGHSYWGYVTIAKKS